MSARNGESPDSTGNANRKSLGGSVPTTCWSAQQRHASQRTPQSARSHGRCQHEHPATSGITALRAHPRCYQKKRVPVDTSQGKRELRAEVMRKLGMDVDCAAYIAEAHSWRRAALYDLLLIHVEKGRGQRHKFCDDVRSATRPQRLGLRVGQPEYLADSPNTGDVDSADDLFVGGVKVASSANREDLTQRWGHPGIFTANLRSPLHVPGSHPNDARPARSATRFRERPSKPTTTPTSLHDLLREELQ